MAHTTRVTEWNLADLDKPPRFFKRHRNMMHVKTEVTARDLKTSIFNQFINQNSIANEKQTADFCLTNQIWLFPRCGNMYFSTSPRILHILSHQETQQLYTSLWRRESWSSWSLIDRWSGLTAVSCSTAWPSPEIQHWFGPDTPLLTHCLDSSIPPCSPKLQKETWCKASCSYIYQHYGY